MPPNDTGIGCVGEGVGLDVGSALGPKLGFNVGCPVVGATEGSSE